MTRGLALNRDVRCLAAPAQGDETPAVPETPRATAIAHQEARAAFAAGLEAAIGTYAQEQFAALCAVTASVGVTATETARAVQALSLSLEDQKLQEYARKMEARMFDTFALPRHAFGQASVRPAGIMNWRPRKR